MIRKFKHSGLEKYFLRGTKSGIQAKHVERIRLILGRLHAAIKPQDMNLPGLELHELRGRRKGIWAVKVSGNWRITFKFDGLDAIDINYEDYH
jgi:toxin HigB-1